MVNNSEKTIKLKLSDVRFDQELHKYTLNGVELQGITGMLSRHIFPDEYKDVPQFILDRAKDKGSFIHECCELVDELDVIPDCPEARAYARLRDDNLFLRHEASEYVVSDNKHFASCIDKVYRLNEDTFMLADIKTTYKLNIDYVSWQLSVYAYLFELQNPSAKIERLSAIWLRDNNAKLVDVQRIDNEIIKDLLKCELEGRLLILDKKTTLPAKYSSMEAEIKNIIEQEKEWSKKKKTLIDGIRKEMVLSGEYNWLGNNIKITRNKETIKKDFDKEAFKNDFPELYAKYIREVPVSGSLTIKTI